MANNSQSLPLSLHFRSSLPRRRSSASLVLTKMKINLYFFYSISDFQVIRNFPKKIKNLFPKKHYEKIQMNPAINKQKKKKKNPKIFWVTKQKIFQRNLTQ